jgi:hypothetical protein
MALMTKVKSPRLSIFTGSVNINSMGRKKAFSIPRIAAAENADKKPLTCIPSIKYDVAMIENVRINHLRKSPLILFPYNFESEAI